MIFVKHDSSLDRSLSRPIARLGSIKRREHVSYFLRALQSISLSSLSPKYLVHAPVVISTAHSNKSVISLRFSHGSLRWLAASRRNGLPRFNCEVALIPLRVTIQIWGRASVSAIVACPDTSKNSALLIWRSAHLGKPTLIH